MTTPTAARPELEVADIIRQQGKEFLARYGSGLAGVQRQALDALARCRTAALGGHVERCLDCGHRRMAYNSCRNRHCPKCQALARAEWLDRQAEQLLPVEYHHVVFTLPPAVAALGLAHPRVVYDLLMRSAAATLQAVAANPKRLGAVVGVLMVLHTWGQNLHHHPHVHCVVTGGGLSCNERGDIDESPRWVSCRPGFFLPVRVLSRVFRGKFVAGLRAAIAAGTLAAPVGGDAWWSALYARDWVIYSKRPFGGPAQVLKYLARYTHRVAISNHRLVKLEAGRVTFRYKDYADNHRPKTMTLDAVEFLRRFVQHILPKGFMKIRHYGLLANGQRQTRLTQCRRLLLAAGIAAQVAATADRDDATIAPAEVRHCPQCGSCRIVVAELDAESCASAAVPDSS